MIYFKFHRKYFQLIGVALFHCDRNVTIKQIIKFFAFLLYMGPFTVWFSIAFLYAHRNELDIATWALSAFLGTSVVTAELCFIKLNEAEIGKLISAFQQMIDKVPQQFKKFYETAEMKGRRWTSLAIKIIYCTLFISLVVLPLVSACYNIAMGNFDTNQWLQHFPIKFPYEKPSIFGYFMHTLYGLFAGIGYFTITMLVLTFFVHCCLLTDAVCFHIQSVYEEIDCHSKRYTSKNADKIKANLIQIIEIQAEIMRASEKLAKIMSGPLFFRLFGNLLISSSSLLMTEKGLAEMNVKMFLGIYIVLVATINIFIYCYIANRISSALSALDDLAYCSEWYNYPADVRKYLILLMQRAQRPVNFHGLKLIYCNLMTFSQIIRLIWSYYLMLRNLKAD